MKKAEKGEGDPPNRISPKITPSKILSSKHPAPSPARKKNKLSKHQVNEDVHSTSPVTPSRSTGSLKVFTSPQNTWSPSSFSSQDEPDVTWDYSSPKLPDGASRSEGRLLTIQDLTRSMSIAKKALRNQRHLLPVPSSPTPSSTLVDKFMLKNYEIVLPPVHQSVSKKKPIPKGAGKLKSYEKLMKVMESLTNFGQNPSTSDHANLLEHTSPAEENVQKTDGVIIRKTDSSFTSFVGNQGLKGVSGDGFDSDEDLWGEDDPSYICRATQLSIEAENELSNMNSTSQKASPGMADNDFSIAETMLPQENKNNSKCVCIPDGCLSQESVEMECTKYGVFYKTEPLDEKYSFSKSNSSVFPTVGSYACNLSLPPKSYSNTNRFSSSRDQESHIGITVDYAESSPIKGPCRPVSVDCAESSPSKGPYISVSVGYAESSPSKGPCIPVSVDYAESSPSKGPCRLPVSVDKSGVNDNPGKRKEKKYTFSKKINSSRCLLSKDKQSYTFCDKSVEYDTSRTSNSQNASANNSEKEHTLKGKMSCENMKDNKACSQSRPTPQQNCTGTLNTENGDCSLESVFDNDFLEKPEVWSLLDKLETEHSSQVKYSPEEIAHKKAAALKRRLEKQLMKRKG